MKNLSIKDTAFQKLTLQEVFYYAFFILLSITKGLGFYEGQAVFKLLVIPAFICVLLKIFITPYTVSQWAAQAVLLSLSAFIYFESGQIGIFFVTFTILGMKNISVKKVFKIGLCIWSGCAILLSIFSFFRLEHTIYRVHPKMGLGPIFRWSLGFTHPNILHITYFVLCAYIIYELADDYNFKHLIFMMIGNALVFIYSISYTGFGITALLLAGGIYVKVRPKFNILEKAAINLILPLLIIVSFVLPLILYMPWVEKINDILGSRILLANLFLQPEYVSLFGIKTADIVRSSMTLDSSYIWGFINYGIIPFILLMAAYFILIFDYTRKQKTRELLIILSFLIAGFTEQLLFNTSFKNITLFFIGELLFRQKEAAKEYCLFPSLKKEIEIPALKLDLKALPIKKSIAYIAVCTVIAALLCAVLRTQPKGYIVPRVYTDGYDKYTSIYLTDRNAPEYEGYVVMNYQDDQTPMQIVEGNAVWLETFRYYLGSIMLGILTGYIICFIKYNKVRLRI